MKPDPFLIPTLIMFFLGPALSMPALSMPAEDMPPEKRMPPGENQSERKPGESLPSENKTSEGPKLESPGGPNPSKNASKSLPVEVETLAGREELPTPLEAIKTTQQNGIAVGPKTFPLEDMLFLRLDPRSPAPRPAEFTLVLRDGGEISGSVSEGDENKVVWRSSTISPETLSIRLEDIRGLLVLLAGSAAGGSEALGGREAPTKAARSEWIRLRKEISSANEKRDQIALLEGGKVQGILEAIEASGVRFSSEQLGSVRVGYNKLRAIILSAGDINPRKEAHEVDQKKPGNQEILQPRVRLSLRDGSRFTLLLSGVESEKLLGSHPSLGALTVPLKNVLEVAFLSGRSSYLSDREPVRAKESLALLRVEKPFQKDTNVLGEPIRMGGREYRKGLGVHSYSLLEYALEGEYSRFQATIGLDESACPTEVDATDSGAGCVVFRARLDDQLLLEKALTWKDAPVPIDLSVKGGKVLWLEVDYGKGQGGFNCGLGRADWGDARILK